MSTSKQWRNITETLYDSYTKTAGQFHWDNERSMDKTCAVKECVTIRQRTKGLGKYKTHEISKTKHVAISENSNWAVLRIAKRLLGLQGFPIRKDSYYQDKYKHTSIWQQMTEGF